MSSLAEKPEKKHKKDKSKSEKKRLREEDGVDTTERKHKKSKSIAQLPPPDSIAEPIADVDARDEDAAGEKKKKKKKESIAIHARKSHDDEAKAEKKHKKKQRDVTEDEEAVAEDKEERKKKKKSKKQEPTEDVADEANSDEDTTAAPVAAPIDNADAMDLDDLPEAPTKSAKLYQPPDIPENPQFPFFTQTVSLYEPIYPIGWATPVTSSEAQHLRHLQNRYVHSLKGVLLDYRNVSLGEFPGRAGAATDDEGSALLVAKNEAAVGFGWVTADVDLFVPSRGAWMEGSVNLQTEGHIGVVCFGKFNASIEAKRLPPSWKWIANEAPEAAGFEETASVITADDHGVVRQVHSTGFWSDERGDKVKGKIRFRIRNFDVGTTGDTSYLSLEGTMLDRAGERKLVEEEARLAKVRKDKKRGGNRERRHVPEFSMTRFEVEAEEQPAGQEADALATTV